MDVVLEHSHDPIQPSHMLHQARDPDPVHQHFCTNKDDKDILGISEPHYNDYNLLYRLFIPPHFSMHSPGKDLEPKSSRDVHSRANNHSRVGLAECHTRLHHAPAANHQGLAAPDVQGQEVGCHRRLCDRILVGQRLVKPKDNTDS